ncbi:MAG TPA: ubiquinone/menaquinone biosynthesis methyltransferase [Planctomycetota bacterium]|nr:ubiquinone/menaquinone biosynthesis methyltransferase [Planctomycetota bacterium]
MNASGDSLIPSDANRRMFDRLAPRYDLLNRLLSLGLDRRWRRRAVEALAPRDGEHHLDIGCGSDDMALEILRRAPGCRVIGLDPSQQMLALAAEKAGRAGVGDRLTLAAGDACALPFADGSFAGITSAFALRSFTDRGRAFREMRRVLAPGGRVVLLELTGPRHPLLRAGYWLHTRGLGMVLALLVCGKIGAYRFLLRSVDRFPPAEDVLGELTAAGFTEPRSRPLSAGITTIYTAAAKKTPAVFFSPRAALLS